MHSILDRLYPAQNRFTIRVENMKLNTTDFLHLSEEERSEIVLLKGHMKFGLHNYMPGDVEYITFLRKPLHRIVSYYYYVLRTPAHKLYQHLNDTNMTLHDFVTKIREKDLHNGQIRMISGIDDKEGLMLEKAFENIHNHFSFVGITERFNESLVLLSKRYGWSSPYYRKLNTTTKQPNVYDHKTVQAIEYLNNGDNILYDTMNESLNKMLGNDLSHHIKFFKLVVLNMLYSNALIQTLGRGIRRLSIPTK